MIFFPNEYHIRNMAFYVLNNAQTFANKKMRGNKVVRTPEGNKGYINVTIVG
jgi:hypothetical protein